MIVKLLTEHHLEVLSLKGGCTGSSESTLVKIPHFWKSHVTAHIILVTGNECIDQTSERSDQEMQIHLHSVILMGHMYTVHTQNRRRTTRRLFWIFSACQQNV